MKVPSENKKNNPEVILSYLSEKVKKEIKETLNSIKVIDEDNIKIAQYNGSLLKIRKEIKKDYAIPNLNQKTDKYEDSICYKGDCIKMLKNRWENSLSQKQRDNLDKSLFKALKRSNLSYARYEWLKNYVFYEIIEENNEFSYYGNWGLINSVYENYPLTTGAKKSLKHFLKEGKSNFDKKFGRNKGFDKAIKIIFDKIKTLPKNNKRRKPKIDLAFDAIEKHGKFYGETEPTLDARDGDWVERKITDKYLAVNLLDDDNKPAVEKIKKLRQRLKKKIEN